MTSPDRESGFTLLEILVALFIFAVAGVSMVKSINSSARNLSELELRQFAGLAAHNHMVSVMLLEDVTSASGDTGLADRQFRWQREVSKTDDPRIQRVDLEISVAGNDSVLSQLTGFVGRGAP